MRIFILILICLNFISCANNMYEGKWVEGKGYIGVEGIYNTNNNQKIRVIQSNAKVDFKILDKNGKELFSSNYSLSDFHNWYMYYENNILWIYSSDIGSSYINLNNNYLERIFITPKNVLSIPEVPVEIIEDFK